MKDRWEGKVGDDVLFYEKKSEDSLTNRKSFISEKVEKKYLDHSFMVSI